MKRVQGNGLPIECVNPILQKYIVRWDVKPYFHKDEITGEEVQSGYDYYEKWLNHKPTMDEVKEIVLGGMNAIIDQRILDGFKWNGMEIWLSKENQFNYKAAFDLAIQTNGGNLPVVFKFGTAQEPVYYTFSSIEELMDFYTKAMSYINNVLADGWKEKDSIEWNIYETLLNN